MNILLIGSGGREHALAWKLLQASTLTKLYMTATNGSVKILSKNSVNPVQAVAINDNDHPALIQFAKEKNIEIVVIGSEAPLAAGLSDAFQKNGIAVFGPTQAAAQIESSKSFAKDFMLRHNIPTARYEIFNNFSAAKNYLHNIDYPIVIKASGLAAGKGVFLPSTVQEAETILHELFINQTLGHASDEVVIEERLYGPEVSLLAFSDGITVKPMPPARDHKRLLDDDKGPNTGGMGVYAPVPNITAEQIAEWTQTILQPTIDGLREEGKPFVGVLYAGLMLTTTGPKVLEFNCRFGDPETQVLMALLKTDLVKIIHTCVTQQLAHCDIHWKSQTAICVILAAKNYPEAPQTGDVIAGLEIADLPGPPIEKVFVKSQTSIEQLHDLQAIKKDMDGYVSDHPAVVFHAGTKWQNEQLLTAGGRVLGVTAWSHDLAAAKHLVYAEVKAIHFDGMQYRKDIGS